MKSVLCCAWETPFRAARAEYARPEADTGREALLAEIGRVGGDANRRGAERALEALEVSIARSVRENPEAYEAAGDPESQRRAVSKLVESVGSSFLLRTVEDLRRREGYVQVWGHWIHRAVFTFIGFGLLAAAALPLCAVSLMSTYAWGWLPGGLGIATAALLGAWILGRIRFK